MYINQNVLVMGVVCVAAAGLIVWARSGRRKVPNEIIKNHMEKLHLKEREVYNGNTQSSMKGIKIMFKIEIEKEGDEEEYYIYVRTRSHTPYDKRVISKIIDNGFLCSDNRGFSQSIFLNPNLYEGGKKRHRRSNNRRR